MQAKTDIPFGGLYNINSSMYVLKKKQHTNHNAKPTGKKGV